MSRWFWGISKASVGRWRSGAVKAMLGACCVAQNRLRSAGAASSARCRLTRRCGNLRATQPSFARRRLDASWLTRRTTMADLLEFELVFALPEGEHDAYVLSDAVFEAGYEDAVIGTGNPRLLGVEIEDKGEDAENVILRAARAILKGLPAGSKLHEVRPDLVSLADVAEKLKVRRQALQQREMPLPVSGGLYRVDDMLAVLTVAMASSRRRPRFDLEGALKWFVAGTAARQVNAKLAMQQIDPVTAEPRNATRLN